MFKYLVYTAGVNTISENLTKFKFEKKLASSTATKAMILVPLKYLSNFENVRYVIY